MSERLTAADVRNVALLARLAVTDDEVELYTRQLDGMLDHFADIDALDLSDVEPMTQPIPLSNVFRADVPGATLDPLHAAALVDFCQALLNSNEFVFIN